MGTWRCGTCHNLMVRNQQSMCRAVGHEAPYDDEAGDDYE